MTKKEVLGYMLNPAAVTGLIAHQFNWQIHALTHAETCWILAIMAGCVGLFYWLTEQEVLSLTHRKKEDFNAKLSDDLTRLSKEIAALTELVNAEIARQDEEYLYRQIRMWAKVDRWSDEIASRRKEVRAS